MSPIPNPRVIFNSVPKEYPVPGETLIYQPDSETIDLDAVSLNGGILVKTLYLSMDPYMRWRMRDTKEGYSTPFEIGKPPEGEGIGLVIRSESPKFQTGDHLQGYLGWSAYTIISEADAEGPIQNPSKLPWSAFLGVGGMPARTAFYSLREYGAMKKGETIFVTTAAGAVGSVVVQLAVLAGLKVIASTGDDAKVAFVKDVLKADVVFNYKTTDTRKILQEHGPIDIYFDNVGGQSLDAALEFAKQHGRFILCGYVSEYNRGDNEQYGIKNMGNVLSRSLHLNGFIVADLISRVEGGIKPFLEEYVPLVANGKIKYLEARAHGLEKAGGAFLELLTGGNQGKAIIVVAEE